MEPAQKRARLIDQDLPVSQWDIDDVSEFLQDIGFQDDVQLFRRQQINGQALLMLDTEALLEKVGVEPIGRRLQLLQILNVKNIVQRPRSANGYKVFMDPVHGHIEIHPLCVKIIDTPQFQRLRYIKQLGGCYYVYPGASHNRFEHSLGVCHLAGRLVREIQQRQPELCINEVDVLSVMIAGLCYDLGHGPFSQMFDRIFIPRATPNSNWKNEEASIMMLDHLIDENDLKSEFEKYGLSEKDALFIKEQIAGPSSMNGLYHGRDEDKHFLYEVVANKRNGVDVDKWDSFARDCHHLGIKNSFDHVRVMTYARVLDVGSQKQICIRDKDTHDIFEMLDTKQRFYRRYSLDNTVQIIEYMLVQALLKANEYLLTEGTNGRMLKISETIEDMQAYTKITDQVILRILYSSDPKLEEARRIIQQVQERQLYKCIGQTKPKKGKQFTEEEAVLFAEEIVEESAPQEVSCPKLHAGDILVMPLSLDYGLEDENPIDRARLYMKNNPTVAIQIRREQISNMLPEHFKDQHIYVFCKRLDQQSRDEATRCFHAWCAKREDLEIPKGGDVFTFDMSPFMQTSQKSSASDAGESSICGPDM